MAQRRSGVLRPTAVDCDCTRIDDGSSSSMLSDETASTRYSEIMGKLLDAMAKLVNADMKPCGTYVTRCSLPVGLVID